MMLLDMVADLLKIRGTSRLGLQRVPLHDIPKILLGDLESLNGDILLTNDIVILLGGPSDHSIMD